MREIYTVYRCDQCKKVLSDGKRLYKRHLSINFSGYSGFVEHNSELDSWDHVTTVRNGITQLCDTACLSAFMEAASTV